MPDNLPQAVLVLLWLLIGVILVGYLIMRHTWGSALFFVIPYYGAPLLWRQLRHRRSSR